MTDQTNQADLAVAMFNLLQNETERRIHQLNEYQDKIRKYNDFMQERTFKFNAHLTTIQKVLKSAGITILEINSIYKTGNGMLYTDKPEFEVTKDNSFYLRGSASINRVRTDEKKIHEFITKLQYELKEKTNGVISIGINSYGMRNASKIDFSIYVY